MEWRPTVSIGLPVYNAADYLEETLDSLLSQTYRPLEIVISDNASTDRTSEICESAARADGQVRFFRNPTNVGVFANYCLVFRRSSGSFFKWASANDWCAPTFIEACVDALVRQPDAVLCHSKTKLFSDDLAAAVPDSSKEMGLQQSSPSARVAYLLESIRLNNLINGVIRRANLERTGLHRPYYSSDLVLLAELAVMGKFIELPEYLFYRRMTKQSATRLMSNAERDAYVFGAGGGPKRSDTFRWHLDLASLVVRGQLGLRERLRLLRYVTRNIYWELAKLRLA